MAEKIRKSEEEWKRELTPEQFAVARQKGTERAFSGQYWNCHEDGIYRCSCCGAELFSSATKFDSGTGWPSFTEPSDRANVELEDDYSFGMHRIEVNCAACGGHLGHVFPDGPGRTGERYCINSCSLEFDEH